MVAVPHSLLSPRTARRRGSAIGLALVLIGSSATVAVAAPAADAVPAGRYYAIAPTRILDTRLDGGAVASGATRVVDLSPAVGATAAAVVVNLTVTGPSAGGYLTAFPAGTTRPLASSLNFGAGETRANSVTVAVGQGGFQSQLAIAAAVANSGSAQVIVDVLGWYGDTGSAGAGASYLPLLAPSRLFDTRTHLGALTATAPKNVDFVQLDYGSPDINRTITAAVMNITVTQTAGPGYLTIWNGLGPPPLVSTINWARGGTVANLAIVPVRCTDPACTSVTFFIKNNVSPSTQVIGDIAGIYTTPTARGLVYSPVSPTRITDTRLHQPYGRLGPKGTGTTNVSRLIVPGTRALDLNVTAVLPTQPTYLTVYTTGNFAGVSTLNATPGTVVANAAQVKISTAGQFSTFNAAGTVDVVVDLQGMFVPDPAAAAASAAPVGSTVSGTIG